MDGGFHHLIFDMKKVNIITYYNANNHGAFLQSYALMKFLVNNGYQVTFKGLQIHSQICDDTYTTELNKVLIEAQKLLPIDWSDSRYDVSIVGSDEVFNFNNATYCKFPYFNGSNLNTQKLISYAASIGASNYKKLLIKNFLRYCGLRKFDNISVRDKRTEKFVKIFYKKKISIDVDPTLLVDFDSELISSTFEKYVLVYTYGLKEEHIRFIKKFAEKRGLKIIATGAYCAWCDFNLAVSPFEWIGLVKNADYIFTSTFHGTIFSIKYQKQFIALVDNARKVKELLDMLGISERYCQSTDFDEIMHLVESGINYSRIGIDSYIKASQRRLLEMLQ